ncbi:OB-fold nucleic acid binding domain-containing protein [Allostreptomyces psammosilenae]|uniref:RecG-like helicase n=1 Tax=Allostreptomyces psammosilenae TaxID=1892865 RepID=A0A852ZL69_9ACTN|nr:OB-fold nucleic acid binding domain-containing protein [Allostreptomyces psammosilenae]NYI03153.1 RecG-like helicase [Allostreptomyces psammosilenae]
MSGVAGSSGTVKETGRFRRMLNRLTSTPEELQAEELEQHAVDAGCSRICDCPDREVVTVTGTLRAVTQRPRGGVPALEAELFDGSGAIDVVWLGRRSIAGIEPGRRIVASGRVSSAQGRKVLFNPRYELRAIGQE